MPLAEIGSATATSPMNPPTSSPTALKTAGLLLAGGQSRRMGQNKALLRVTDEGSTLLEFMQQLLRQAGCEPVLVSGAAVGGLPDRVADAGPLAGIDAALLALAERHDIGQLLVVPVDMPGLSPSLLETLLAAGEGCQAVHFEQSPLPLLLPNTAATRAVVQAQLASPSSRSLQVMARAVGVRLLAWPEPGSALDNLNTPADWQSWLARHQVTAKSGQESP